MESQFAHAGVALMESAAVDSGFGDGWSGSVAQ